MNRHPWSGFARSALGAAVAIVVAAPALAQNTTSAIGGQVVDVSGAPVAGAAVSIAHTESGSVSNVTTGADGRYAARGLRVGGPYTITISKGGQVDKREGIFLTLAESTGQDITLGTATVVVTGQAASQIFNSSAMGAGTSISGAQLNSLASIQRSLQDYARTDPRLAQTDKERGEISAAGQNTRYNSITIDGVAINDTFGLESNNLPTAKQPISIDAIQSVQVNISNYDVTQKGYTGANINAVTKSGTNDVRGSVYYVYRDDSMVGKRFNKSSGNEIDTLPFKEDTLGFTLGGPIIKDKLFFFVNYEDLKSNRAQPEFGPVGSQLTNVAITPAAITKLQEIARRKYGFDAGQVSGNTTLNVKDALLKLDWNINDQHRANLRFARTEQDETNGGSFGGYSATGLQLTSAWYTQKKKIDTLVGQWFADWSDTFSTELKISTRDYNSVPINIAKLPAMALRFNGSDASFPAGVNTGSRFLNFGTERSRHFNVLDTQTTDLYLGGTLALKDHELKFGGDLTRNKVYNAFFQDTNGNYTFTCQNGTYSIGAVNCTTGTAAQIETAVLELFEAGRASSFQVQVPTTAGGLDAGIAKWTLTSAGLFLQDTWKVNKQLTLTGGLRYDRLSTDDQPLANVTAAAPTVAGSFTSTGVTARNTGGFGLDNTQTADGEALLQPRLGFNYKFDREDKRQMQLRGGVGLFQGAAANVWLSNPYSNTGMTTKIIGCGITGFSACSGSLLSVDPNNQPQFTGSSPAANVDYIAKGLGQPSVWKFNLAFDSELPWYGLVAGAEWLHTRTNTGIFYQHLNLGGATASSPVDGRQQFWMPQTYNPTCWTSSGASISTTGACAGSRSRALSNQSFNNVLLATETNKGGGNAVTLALTAPNRSGFGWQVAYTYTEAKEVSPLTSSVANSNFNSRSIFNPNEDVESNSAYLVRDRISANATWSRAFYGSYKTTFGMFYEARKGKPYSWTYGNDMNGDGVSGNDLMYIPKGSQSGEVVFAGDTATNRSNEDRFWAVVDANPVLGSARGKVVSRNSAFSPWVNNFDLRISQEVPGFTSKQKGRLSLDILNFGNLLNKKWGRINEMGFSSAGGNRRTFVNYGGTDSAGRYVYYVNNVVDDTTLRQVKGESQWGLQITARYEF